MSHPKKGLNIEKEPQLTSVQVLVDGPATDAKNVVPRHSAALSDVSLLPIVIKKLPRAAGNGPVKAAWEKAKVEETWANSAWAKNRERSVKRRQLTDFERFKVMRLRKQVSRVHASAGRSINTKTARAMSERSEQGLTEHAGTLRGPQDHGGGSRKR